MAARTSVSIVHKRALNQVLIYTAKAPAQARTPPLALVRALRSALRMSQAQLARRCGLPQAHIARLEAGPIDVQLGTLSRMFDALFCDLLILPKARQRPGDAVAERVFASARRRPWD